jgi:hypothetical protein
MLTLEALLLKSIPCWIIWHGEKEGEGSNINRLRYLVLRLRGTHGICTSRVTMSWRGVSRANLHGEPAIASHSALLTPQTCEDSLYCSLPIGRWLEIWGTTIEYEHLERISMRLRNASGH